MSLQGLLGKDAAATLTKLWCVLVAYLQRAQTSLGCQEGEGKGVVLESNMVCVRFFSF